MGKDGGAVLQPSCNNLVAKMRDFGLPFSTLFQAQDRKEPQYVGAWTELLNLASTCQSPHLAKIQDIESISEPPLPIELYTICQNVSLDNFRKALMKFHPQISRSTTRWNGCPHLPRQV
jgi:hypothetical protein